MIGAYVLANDGVYEHFVAFVKSFRKYNPTLPLTVIQYNNQVERIEQLSKVYNFKIWNPADGDWLNEIGSRWYPNNAGWARCFRKVCCFWGEYDTFMMFDADIVLLDDYEPILKKFEANDASLLYFDAEALWVYKEGPFRDKMTTEYGSVHFNAGLWGSKKNELTHEGLKALMDDFDNVKDNFIQVIEQPLMNYYFDINRLKKVRVTELMLDRAFATWFDLEVEKRGDKYYWIYPDKGGQITAMHWAGCSFADIHKHHSATIFLHFRLMGESLYTRYRYLLNFYHIRSIDLITKWKYLRELLALL